MVITSLLPFYNLILISTNNLGLAVRFAVRYFDISHSFMLAS